MSINLESTIDKFLKGSIETITDANVQELNVTENGTYTPPSGVDGYAPVNVAVPEAVLEEATFTDNGVYTPPSGVDGFNQVTVSVEHPSPVLDSIAITENGNYTPPSGVDGYNDITVNVPDIPPVLDTLNVTANGTYTPTSGTDGYNEVNVNVPLPANGYLLNTLSTPTSLLSYSGGVNLTLNKFINEIKAEQSGSGTPSPDNVRPISGWTSQNIWIQNVLDVTQPATHNISWSTEVGSVYGGTLNVLTGLLTVTHQYVSLGSIADAGSPGATVGSNGLISFNGVNAIIKKPATNYDTPDLICTDYETHSRSGLVEYQICINTAGNIIVCDTAYVGELLADIPTLFASKYVVYELDTPLTYQLSGIQVKTLTGTNYIFIDTGDTLECEYFTK